MQLTLTLKMTTARVVGTSVTVNNSPIQDYVHLDGHPQPTHVKYNNYAEICDRPAKHPVYDFSLCSAAWSNCSLCLLFKLLCLQSNTGECFLTSVMPLFSYILINTYTVDSFFCRAVFITNFKGAMPSACSNSGKCTLLVYTVT